MKPEESRERDDAREGAAELEVALDALGDKVKLLVERSRRLAERCREEESVRQRLAGGTDPAVLDERVRELESENDRLARHAEFLEAKVKDLLSRVRYVVEA